MEVYSKELCVILCRCFRNTESNNLLSFIDLKKNRLQVSKVKSGYLLQKSILLQDIILQSKIEEMMIFAITSFSTQIIEIGLYLAERDFQVLFEMGYIPDNFHSQGKCQDFWVALEKVKEHNASIKLLESHPSGHCIVSSKKYFLGV